MKKTFAAVMIFLLILAPIVTQTRGAEMLYPQNQNEDENVLLKTFEKQLRIMEQDNDMDREVLTIEYIRNLYDFDDNLFKLCELSPQGYIIFHVESEIFVEYSAVTHSPYYEVKEDIYYGGLCGYYKKINGNIYDILSEKIIDAEDRKEMQKLSSEINEAFCENSEDNFMAFGNNADEIDNARGNKATKITSTGSSVGSDGYQSISGGEAEIKEIEGIEVYHWKSDMGIYAFLDSGNLYEFEVPLDVDATDFLEWLLDENN